MDNNTGKDAVVGNEQKAAAFWIHIKAYFASSPKVAGLQKQDASHCKQRWQKINDLVCKFIGCYEHAKSQRSSGQSEVDVIKVAYELFYNNHTHKFTLEHAWRELCNDQKWCASSKGDGSSKRRKVDDGCAQSSNSNTVSHLEEETMARPPGVKAAKGKGKRSLSQTRGEKGEGSSLVEFEGMWAIKEKELVMKEKLSKIVSLKKENHFER